MRRALQGFGLEWCGYCLNSLLDLPILIPIISLTETKLVSRLSLGVLIVEAADRSGGASDCRARPSIREREVFAVPGNINSKTSQGTNTIIKQGADLVTSAADILEELKFLVTPGKTDFG